MQLNKRTKIAFKAQISKRKFPSIIPVSTQESKIVIKHALIEQKHSQLIEI
jgi:hypothetical protein